VRYDIEAAKLASERAAAVVHRKMGRGRASLAAIASSAAFIGIFGTLVGIVDSFVGCGGEKSTCMAVVTRNLSEAIIPTAWSILVAIFASWGHGYLCAKLESLDTEMRAASFELANSLSLLRRRY
jgi:biopolymer transport protein TolQ